MLYTLTNPSTSHNWWSGSPRNKVIFSVKLHPTYEFTALILGYQAEIRIVKPAWLKDMIFDLLDRMILNYQR